MLSANRSTSVEIGGIEYLYFGGTNYLGIAHRIELLEAAQKTFAIYGWSSGASRLTSGENDVLIALETELADFSGAETSLALSAGFLANQAVVEGIDEDVSAWVISKDAHASIQAAVRQSRKPVVVIDEHSYSKSLRERSDLASFKTLGIFFEPIEALTGKLMPVDKLMSSTAADDFVILDEAQSFGVLGDRGRGALEHFSLPATSRVIRTGTFSKAIGTYGGFVLAAQEIIESIMNNSGSVRGSTSLPPLQCAATLRSIRLIREEPDSTLKKMRQNIGDLNSLLVQADFRCEQNSCVPIYYLPFSEEVQRMQASLTENGILIPSMSNYFPGISEVGMRWTIQSGHTHDDLVRLVEVLSLSKNHLGI